jgi:ferredoxin-type protein NapH
MKKRQRIRKGIIIISFFFFPITLYYQSPVLPLGAATMGLISGSLLTFFAMGLSALFAGRAFCGWICPAGGLQEVCMVMSEKPTRRMRILKYILWVPWIAGLIYFFITAGGVKGIDFFFQTTNGISLMDSVSYIVYYAVGTTIVLMALLIGKRSFCHHLCWMMPFMAIGEKLGNLIRLPRLKLKAETQKCIKCNACTHKCVMSLDVMGMVQKGNMRHIDCILCGACVDSCPKNVIHYSVG